MMSAKPIIHSVAAPNDWVVDGRCGISIEAENSEALSEAIVQMSAKSSKDLSELGNNGKDFCQRNFNYKDLADRFLTSVQ